MMCDAVQTQTYTSGHRTIGTRSSRPHLFVGGLLMFHAMVPASRTGQCRWSREDALMYSFVTDAHGAPILHHTTLDHHPHAMDDNQHWGCDLKNGRTVTDLHSTLLSNTNARLKGDRRCCCGCRDWSVDTVGLLPAVGRSFLPRSSTSQPSQTLHTTAKASILFVSVGQHTTRLALFSFSSLFLTAKKTAGDLLTTNCLSPTTSRKQTKSVLLPLSQKAVRFFMIY